MSPARRGPTSWLSAQWERGYQAFKILLAGEPLTPTRQSDLDYFQNAIGLKKPLADYSPRSQRRIIAGAREGRTVKETYRAEYTRDQQRHQQSRQQHSLQPGQWRTIEKLRNTVIGLGVDVDPYMDDDVLNDFAQIYGFTYLRTVLTNQIDSTRKWLAYRAGHTTDPGPGKARWDARGQLEKQFAISHHVIYALGTDPYYYYHGRLK